MEITLENHKDGRSTVYRPDLPFVTFKNNESAKSWILEKYGEIQITEQEATSGIIFSQPVEEHHSKKQFSRR